MVVIPSTLDAVTVYAEGALCTRLASVPSAEGRLPRQVRIEGLSLGLRPGSLRATVLQGPAGLQVRDIRPAFDVRLPPETDIPTAQHALEAAQDRMSTLAVASERVQRDIAALQKLKPSFPPRKKDEPLEPREASLQAVLALAGFVDSELATLFERQIALEREYRDALEEVELCRRRLEEGSSAVRGQRARLHRAAVITLSDVGPVQEGARLALEYAVLGARWVPGYDLRMPRTLDGGTLRMRASILQRTGEDWTGVKLALSTAQLERRADVPELKALRIGRRQPPPARSGWREPPPGLDELFAGYDAIAPSEPSPSPKERSPVREFAMPPQGMLQEESFGGAPEPVPAEVAAAPRRITQSVPSVGASKPMPPRAGGVAVAAGPPPPAPPPPPPGAAPSLAAPPPMAAPAMKKSASLMRRRASEEMSKDREYAPEAEESVASLDEGGYGGGGSDLLGTTGSFAPVAPQGAVSRVEPAADLLDYGGLRMAPASNPGERGRLRPHGDETIHQQLLMLGVHVHVDVFALVAHFEQQAEAVDQVPPPTWSVPPRQSTPQFDARFDVEARAEVPSDGVWHTVPVFSAPVGLSAEYVCVPSIEPRAFRTVKVENRTPHALLAGPVDVTLGEEFLMTSPLPTLAPGAVQRLGLGVEESLKVSRNTRFDEVAGGVFGGATVLIHHVKIELANRTSQRAAVEVLERVPAIPLSEKDIKVEETEIKPPWSRRALLAGETPVEGERAWKVVLQPGETQTLSATWSIRIPASKMLVGGNRRTS